MVYLLWRLGKPPCTVHIFIPTILLLALFRKEERAFFAQKQDLRFFFSTNYAEHASCAAIRPVRAAPFPAPTQRGARTAAGGFAPNGRGSFAEIQRGIALCGARESAAPAAGAKRRDNLRFSFLFELLPFPWIVWRRLPTCDRCEIGERQRIFSSVSFAAYSQGQIVFCYTGRLLLAGAT